jgi:small subunit ribosomal protein S2
VSDLVARGEKILFVGTKKQAQESIEEEAERAGQLYINKRWMGGMLTNFKTIRLRLQYLADLEARKERGEFANLPKAEASKLDEQIVRLTSLLGGIKNMRKLPDALFVVDTKKEEIAVKEANKLGIPVVAPVDTNCDPDVFSHKVPGNDDAIRAIRLFTNVIAEAVLEGKNTYDERQQGDGKDTQIDARTPEADVSSVDEQGGAA